MDLALMSLLAVVLFWPPSPASSLRVLRNTVAVAVPDPTGGAKLIPGADGSSADVEDITICVRFNLKVLGSLAYLLNVNCRYLN